MRFIKQFAVVAAVALVGSRITAAMDWSTAPTLLLGVATAAATLLAYAWIVRRTEHRSPAEIALPGAPRALARGALVGLGMFVAVIGAVALAGDYRADGHHSLAGPIAILGVMAGAAVTEELVFRGVLFRIAEERLGTWAALTLSGALFGLAHLSNPHATVWSSLAIAVEAGGMLAAAYAATRSLWLTIGLHFAWNYAESGIFGVADSGQSTPAGILHGRISGSALLSGGQFGPEASVFALIAGTAVMAAFMLLAHRRGRVVAFRRSARVAAATLAA